jgi:hypothetical protein
MFEMTKVVSPNILKRILMFFSEKSWMQYFAFRAVPHFQRIYRLISKRRVERSNLTRGQIWRNKTDCKKYYPLLIVVLIQQLTNLFLQEFVLLLVAGWNGLFDVARKLNIFLLACSEFNFMASTTTQIKLNSFWSNLDLIGFKRFTFKMNLISLP